ncbi:palmitoyltransferase ERF2 [Purpureocillium lavendulum]|uniref:Palmitoyltransferase ERF2 n=1 Tax=Purpureocillium lavendulum TaxID=1247861 RepID=A0AB34FQH8_9HYPO|nr:palmitoyltransferase ERF2 [Purpureocillium lavendulum]
MASNEELPKIKLYWLNGSRSQRIMWLLEELKVPYDVEVFHRNKQTMLAPPELERIHPLGKSPVVTVLPAGAPAGTEPLVLAESGLMTEYLCEHLPEGARLVPRRWKDGCEGKIGGETEAWMRYRYLLHYAEGSLMPTLVVALVTSQLKSPAQVPFIVRPITSIAANRILSQFVFPNALKHLRLIESYLETSGGRYLCGDALTAADILMSFPLIAAKDRWDEMGRFEGGSWARQFPRVARYVELLEAEEGYRKSVEAIEKIDGKFSPSL